MGSKLTWTAYFNPRSPYGERRSLGRPAQSHGDFNPRSPYGERPRSMSGRRELSSFQSTLPLRGATAHANVDRMVIGISIHAPLTGSDSTRQRDYHLRRNFNPRSPYGERPMSARLSTFILYFNPRSPYGERPARGCVFLQDVNFNPRSPYGERRLTSRPCLTLS